MTQSPKATAFKNNTITEVSLSEARDKAPAIFAESPAPHIKAPSYAFTPTTEIISHMKDMGYVLTHAAQSRTSDSMREKFGTHLVKFQHPDLYIKDSNGDVEARPEVIIFNSHDGVRPVQFEQGLFRLVCSNGLVVKTQDFGSFRERHTKYSFQEVKNLIDKKVDSLSKIVKTISTWNSHTMTDKQRHDFAVKALEYRMRDERQPDHYEIVEILTPKRAIDSTTTLWHTYNVVQENLIRGGYQMNNRTARAITNPIEDLRINQGLWQLADSFVD
jgi:hypothetical protein